MQSSSFFCEIKIWRGNFCRNRHIWTLGGTFDFFSFFHIPSICPNSEQPNFSQDISPFWQLNSEPGSFQLAEPTKTLSFYWLSLTKRGFCICNLFIIRISISFFFKLRIVLLDKRLNSKLKRIRWASGLIGSKREQLPWTWKWFCPYINFYKNIFPLQWSWVKVVIQVSRYLFSEFSHLE